MFLMNHKKMCTYHCQELILHICMLNQSSLVKVCLFFAFLWTAPKNHDLFKYLLIARTIMCLINNQVHLNKYKLLHSNFWLEAFGFVQEYFNISDFFSYINEISLFCLSNFFLFPQYGDRCFLCTRQCVCTHNCLHIICNTLLVDTKIVNNKN